MPDATARPCVECGEDFTPRRRDMVLCSRYCSNRVSGRRRKAKGRKPDVLKVLTKVCAWCDKTYTTTRGPGRYCSNHCASYGNGSARLVYDITWRYCKPCDHWRCHGPCPTADSHPVKAPPDLSPRPCHSCGTPFTPASPAGFSAIYCSKQCRTREARARRRGDGRAYRTDRRVGAVRRYAIYERDHWRCQLCGKKVDRRLPVGHRLSATLDHILPVSLGGQWEEANCNSPIGLATARSATRYGEKANNFA